MAAAITRHRQLGAWHGHGQLLLELEVQHLRRHSASQSSQAGPGRSGLGSCSGASRARPTVASPSPRMRVERFQYRAHSQEDHGAMVLSSYRLGCMYIWHLKSCKELKIYVTTRQRAHSSGPVGLVPASSNMQGDGNLLLSLLVALLLKYRGTDMQTHGHLGRGVTGDCLEEKQKTIQKPQAWVA